MDESVLRLLEEAESELSSRSPSPRAARDEERRCSDGWESAEIQRLLAQSNPGRQNPSPLGQLQGPHHSPPVKRARVEAEDGDGLWDADDDDLSIRSASPPGRQGPLYSPPASRSRTWSSSDEEADLADLLRQANVVDSESPRSQTSRQPQASTPLHTSPVLEDTPDDPDQRSLSDPNLSDQDQSVQDQEDGSEDRGWDEGDSMEGVEEDIGGAKLRMVRTPHGRPKLLISTEDPEPFPHQMRSLRRAREVEEAEEGGPAEEESKGPEKESPQLATKREQRRDGNRVLSLFCQGKQMGAVLLEKGIGRLSLLHDVADTSDRPFEAVRSLVEQTGPTAVLAPVSSDPQLVRLLQDLCGEKAQDDKAGRPTPHHNVSVEMLDMEEEERKPVLRLLKSSLFNKERAEAGIGRLFSKPSFHASRQNVRLRCAVDVEKVCCVRALGAAIRYLESCGTGRDTDLDPTTLATKISTVNVMTLDQQIEVDAKSLEALQVFTKEFHPSVYKAGSGREGESLFALCDRTTSKPGSALLRAWFLRPLHRLEVLEERSEAVAFFARPQCRAIAERLAKTLRGLALLGPVAQRFEAGLPTAKDWLQVFKMAHTVATLGQLMQNCGRRPCMMDRLLREEVLESAGKLEALARDYVDLRETKKEGRLLVKDGVNEAVDKRRHLYRSIGPILDKVNKFEQNRIKRWIGASSVIYIPLLGYLLAVQVADIRDEEVARLARESQRNTGFGASRQTHLPEEDFVWDCAGDVTEEEVEDWAPGRRKLSPDGSPTPFSHLPGCEWVLLAEGQALYRTAVINELTNNVGDVMFALRDEELRVERELVDELVGPVGWVEEGCRVAAELDAVLALAAVGAEGGWVRPELTDEPVLDVHKARHPLLIHAVPNYIRSGNPELHKATLLTGPNSSGKTVYLKTVGLIALLASVGSLVPAEWARVGLVDRIFIRIHTVDSVLDGMSTFAKDLNQMGAALRRASAKSLVIVDEFGKGTLSEVGMGLLASSLSYWLDKEEGCPHLFVSTHFFALQQHLPATPLLTQRSMAVDRAPDGSLSFKYKLRRGLADFSHAAYTARASGLPASVVARGVSLYHSLRANTPLAQTIGPNMPFLRISRLLLALPHEQPDKVRHFFQEVRHIDQCLTERQERRDAVDKPTEAGETEAEDAKDEPTPPLARSPSRLLSDSDPSQRTSVGPVGQGGRGAVAELLLPGSSSHDTSLSALRSPGPHAQPLPPPQAPPCQNAEMEDALNEAAIDDFLRVKPLHTSTPIRSQASARGRSPDRPSEKPRRAEQSRRTEQGSEETEKTEREKEKESFAASLKVISGKKRRFRGFQPPPTAPARKDPATHTV